MKATEILNLGIADNYLITSESNIRYICGFTGDSSSLLITPKGNYFFTDFRYQTQAKEEIENCEIIITTIQDRNQLISKCLIGSTLGIEKDNTSIKKFEAYKNVYINIKIYINISDEILGMREIKTNEELEYIKIAAKANEIALENTLKIIKEGVREFEIKAELIYQMNKQGMELSFEPIIASGRNSAKPHATCTDRKIKYKDMLTLDFGSKYFSYCSDITRTFALGSIDEKQKNIYDIVRKAQKIALDVAKVGNKICDVDIEARKYIEKCGFGEYFKHSTGHGVGLEIHELPVVNKSSQGVIKSNTVFTVEPGIYLENEFGVRIEDMIISDLGNIYIFSKELIIL